MMNLSKRQQSHWDEKCQHKTTWGSLMNNKEHRNTTGQSAASQNQYYTQLPPYSPTTTSEK